MNCLLSKISSMTGTPVTAQRKFVLCSGQRDKSGKHLCPPVYGYKKSKTDKNLWVIDEPTAEVVRKIFKLCIDGYGPVQIARILTEQGIPTPTAYALLQGRDNGRHNAKTYRWGAQTATL